MLVSHDRALLRAVCDEFWMVSRGGVEPFDGDLDDYQKYLLDEAKRQRELAKEEAKNQAPKAAAVVTAPVATPAHSPEQIRQWKKALAAVDEKMATLNSEGTALEDKLSTNPHPSVIAETGKRLKLVNQELKLLEDQWLEYTTLLDL
jgi:ATP-binding cassette subfamily F protein 3